MQSVSFLCFWNVQWIMIDKNQQEATNSYDTLIPILLDQVISLTTEILTAG
jgi:hypothetical protein